MATSIGVKLGIEGEKDFRKSLKDVTSQVKTLDKQMETLESTFDDGEESIEQHEQAMELLQKRAEALTTEIDMMQSMVEAASEKYGESSSECQSWEAALASAQTQLNNTTTQIQEHQTAMEESATSFGTLSSEIRTQETQLGDLKTAFMNAFLEFGEDSVEVTNLKDEIMLLSEELDSNKTALEDAKTAYDNFMTSLEDQTDLEDTSTALSNLYTEMTNQETELENLKTEYMNAFLEFGAGSEEVETLSQSIQDLATDLANNKREMEEARTEFDQLVASASELDTEMGNAGTSTSDIGTAATDAVGAFSPAMAGIMTAAASGDLLDAIGGVAGAVGGIATEIINVQTKWQELMGEIAASTGKTGTDAEVIKEYAKELNLSIIDSDFGLTDATSIVTTLDTRLGDTYTASEDLRMSFGEFVSALNVDGATAVNGITDIMMDWGLKTDDVATDTETMIGIMDMLTQAQSMGNVSLDTLMGSLTDESLLYQELGLNIEDVLGFMTAYTQAGGDASTATQALKKAYNTLVTEGVEDIPSAFQAMMDEISNADNVTGLLEQNVLGLDKTYKDVFGKADVSGSFFAAFQRSGEYTEDYTDTIKKSQGTTSKVYNAGISDADKWANTIDKASQTVEDAFTEGTEAQQINASAYAQYYLGYTQHAENLESTVQDSNDGIVDSYDEMVDDAGNSLDQMEKASNDTFEDTSVAAVADMNKMRQQVTEEINQLRNEFNKPLQLNIQTPAALQGGTTGGGYVRDHASGYGHALRMDSPTIFGSYGNSLLMGGDKAGAEIVVGEGHLMNMFADTVKNVGYTGNGPLEAIASLLSEYLPSAGNRQVILDSGEMVGALVNPLNEALGYLSLESDRW